MSPCRCRFLFRVAGQITPRGHVHDTEPQAARLQTCIKRIETAQNTQIYEGTNQIQRMVMARQLLKG